MNVPKKWDSILFEIERSALNVDAFEDCKILINQFEAIDENYRDSKTPQVYEVMWRVALKIGKLSLANLYAEKFLKHLVLNKRSPQIRKFILELNEAGILKKNSEFYLKQERLFLGKKENNLNLNMKDVELLNEHPMHWKSDANFLKQFLIQTDHWDIEKWRLCYEYILLNYFDKDLFLLMLEKFQKAKNVKAEKTFVSLLATKKIKQTAREKKTQNASESSSEHLNIDYDELAMELISKSKSPNSDEQTRVINSLKFIEKEQLVIKGQEMLIAFEFLGMTEVVIALCEKLIQEISNTKERASIYFIWAQTLINNENFFNALQLVDDVIENEPLYGDEYLALEYLKAEALMGLKKYKMAKMLYLVIKKKNPNYRLVEERLKVIETT